MRVFLNLVAAAALVGVVAVGASAATQRGGGATRWTRIDGPKSAGTQLGLLRTSSGSLHVVWAQGAPATIHDTLLSPTGAAGQTTTVAQGFDGVGGLALGGMADGSVRLFAAGGYTPGLPSSQSGINSYVLGGGAWARDPSSIWGGAVASASDYIGETLTKDGQPVTSWKGFVHVGLGAGGPTQAYGADMGTSAVVTDQTTGAVVLSGETITGKGGTFVQQVLPSPGKSVLLPSVLQVRSSGVASRSGAPGVYVAWADGHGASLTIYGGATRKLAGGPFDTANVFSGPAGRLWLTWGDKTSGLFVTRSNRAVTGFEPVQKLRLPANVGVLFLTQGEGSAGPLDLFADLVIGTADRGFWHTHVLARDSLRGAVAKSSGRKPSWKVTLTLTDAGDPLSGAIILVHAGRATKSLTTDAGGHATLTLSRAATVHASASAAGYAAATATVHAG